MWIKVVWLEVDRAGPFPARRQGTVTNSPSWGSMCVWLGPSWVGLRMQGKEAGMTAAMLVLLSVTVSTAGIAAAAT